MNRWGTSVWAIARRDIGSLLANPLGYVFILAFVSISGLISFSPDAYYLRGVADLGLLHQVMPWLLAVLLPAIGMGCWASERERGTEEFLYTWPVPLSAALMGKYVAVVLFYTMALTAHTANVMVLLWLGDPDLGLLLANYLGWWLQGCALAAIAVMASVVMGHVAASFAVGSLLCFVAVMGWTSSHWFEVMSRGLLSVAGLIWMLSIALMAWYVALGNYRGDVNRESAVSIVVCWFISAVCAHRIYC